VYGALADADAAGDLPLAQLQVVIKTQDFSGLSHGQSLSRLLHLLFGGKAIRDGMFSAAKLLSTPIS